MKNIKKSLVIFWKFLNFWFVNIFHIAQIQYTINIVNFYNV